MRLLNTSSGAFKEFHEAPYPEYGILSHRWGHDSHEVSFHDFRAQLKMDTSGHRKVDRFLDIVAADGLSWAWVDTCCIDKTSSAELAEAIISMFSWYQKAEKCYAYLDDVDEKRTWRQSLWWKRGWTLQELIAPASVTFYDAHWHVIGTKAQWADGIQNITRIPAEVLTGRRRWTHWTIAQRLSWAAGRQTKKIEDRAYSLLGLFRVNMSPMYGEGHKAFCRLQLEILQKYPDDSILSWISKNRHGPENVLARSPDDFRAAYTCSQPHFFVAIHQCLALLG